MQHPNLPMFELKICVENRNERKTKSRPRLFDICRFSYIPYPFVKDITVALVVRHLKLTKIQKVSFGLRNIFSDFHDITPIIECCMGKTREYRLAGTAGTVYGSSRQI